MAELMATMVVGPLVSMVKEKASSYLLDKYNVMEGMEEQHEVLKRKLPAILDVIADAEEQAAAHREGAQAWLEALRKVAYEANDVFDEFAYEALRRKARKEGHYRKLGMDNVIKLLPSHNRLVFRYRMGSKLCVVLNAIEVLVAEMNSFGFKFRPHSTPVIPKNLRQRDSEIDDPMKIAARSRAKEKQDIVQRLIAQANNVDLTVLPIVAMGGMGKTTLAQLVYNDPDIQKHFQLHLWVCVSDDFDVDFLAASIVNEAAKKNSSSGTGSEKSPLDKLKEVVSGKRYILVLDDVWNREATKWHKLKSYLHNGGSGSSVLTTTRDQEVAKLMLTTEAYDLNSLNEGFIKEIIMTKAFGSSKAETLPNDNRVEMVEAIANRCVGSPLAASALGSVMSTKTSVDEWKAVLSKDVICDQENGILPILKLSYNHLPSHMRQCFAFCSMFPKDYVIDVQMLIQLWMANGFVPKQQGVCPEIIGNQIFNELVARSFFQDVKHVPSDRNDWYFTASELKHMYCSIITCKIHDLMHDVAMSSMGKECATIAKQLSPSEDFPYSARHLFLSLYRPETVLNASLDKGSPTIQTLICNQTQHEDLQHLSKYNSIRALRLRVTRGSFLKPKHLHHLRYLDLSNSLIKALPEDISILFHLQTLNLLNCELLDRVPKGMKYMTALRHLYTHGCPKLKSMPPDLKCLTSLQTVTCFSVGTGSGCSNVGQLRELDLGGQLELRQLENVIEADAKAGKLGDKKKLTELTLRWTYCNEALNNHKEVMEGLKPHDGLKVLRILSYGSSNYPAWMDALQHMVELELSGCENLEKLPPLWHLASLQVLRLVGLDKINCLCMSETPLTFQKLKLLVLGGMENFEKWWDINEVQGEEPIFAKVEKLKIYGCNRLIALPKASVILESSGGANTMCRSAFPALMQMELFYLDAFKGWEAIEGSTGEQVAFPQLEKLSISDCPNLTTLPEAPKLNELDMREASCQQISLQGASRYINSLTSLRLSTKEPQTTTLQVQAEQNLTDEPVRDEEKRGQKSPLAAMELYRCNFMFFHSGAPALWTCFVQLVDLHISDCHELVFWPEKVFQDLVSLKTLDIFNCRNLTGRTQQASEQSTAARNELLPRLDYLSFSSCKSLVEVPNLPASYLWFSSCKSLVEVPNLPASLKTLSFKSCGKLESFVFSPRQDTTRLVNAEGWSSNETVGNLSLSANVPCLESLGITWCGGLSKVLDLPPSIKTLTFIGCSNLQSLSGQLDAVENLRIDTCKSLVSLPAGPYSSLRSLVITSCPGIKSLPPHLQQQLDYLERKELDARHEGPRLSKPRTWKYAITKNW